MEYRRVNWGFFVFLILEIILILLFVFEVINVDLEDTMISTLVAESTIFLAPVIMLSFKRDDISLKDRLGIKGMKLSTTVMVVLYGIFIMPIGTLANAISLLWVDNTVLETTDSMLSQNWVTVLIATAVVAPLIEEFCFRGFMYNGYRQDKIRFSAVVVSALAFAFMHMNVNQAAYAFIVGIAFALIYEATGSLWASVICHGLFNAESVIFMYLEEYFYPGTYDDLTINRDEILSYLPFYALLAVGGLIFAILFLYLAAKFQNRIKNVRGLFEPYGQGEKKPKIFSAPLVVTLILLFCYMISNEIG